MKLAFGDCVLDLSARQLDRKGSIVSLEPKMYELLETLIRRRGAVVPNVYVSPAPVFGSFDDYPVSGRGLRSSDRCRQARLPSLARSA
jgi:hypothetical protein